MGSASNTHKHAFTSKGFLRAAAVKSRRQSYKRRTFPKTLHFRINFGYDYLGYIYLGSVMNNLLNDVTYNQENKELLYLLK